MPAIRVIRGTRAFGGNHSCSQGSQGCAPGSERRTIVRLLNSLQNLPADANGRLLRVNLFDFEKPLGIVIPIFPTQLVPALGDPSHSAPLAVGDFKYAIH